MRFPSLDSPASIDVLCCNRIEWETLADREEVRGRVSIVVVTDGPRGSAVRYTKVGGEPGLLEIEAFPMNEATAGHQSGG